MISKEALPEPRIMAALRKGGGDASGLQDPGHLCAGFEVLAQRLALLP
jgi:hypothetical protein